MHIVSIDPKQAAKVAALMALIAVMAATWPLAGAAWAFSVHLPRNHFMVLTFVPFFGWLLRRAGMIPVDRAGRASALRDMIGQAKQRTVQGRPLLIFPEGTRTAPGERRPYHPGVAALYGQLGLPVVPVALNSGLFWGRRQFVKRPGTITLEFLPAIPPGLPRKAFMAELERRLEGASARLAKAT